MIRRAFTILALCSALLPGLALADSTSKTFAAKGVTSVDLRILTDLSVQQGDQESLVLTADSQTLSKVAVIVSNGNLIIDSDGAGSLFSRTPRVAAKLTVKSLEKLQIEGGGDVMIAPLKTSRLELNLAGSASVQLTDLHADALDIVVSGRGEITASGVVTGVLVKISGSGDANLTHLESSAAKIAISGKGNVDLAVKDRLDARIAGMGNIHYRGNPTVTRSVSGLGDISQVN